MLDMNVLSARMIQTAYLKTNLFALKILVLNVLQIKIVVSQSRIVLKILASSALIHVIIFASIMSVWNVFKAQTALTTNLFARTTFVLHASKTMNVQIQSQYAIRKRDVLNAIQ